MSCSISVFCFHIFLNFCFLFSCLAQFLFLFSCLAQFLFFVFMSCSISVFCFHVLLNFCFLFSCLAQCFFCWRSGIHYTLYDMHNTGIHYTIYYSAIFTYIYIGMKYIYILYSSTLRYFDWAPLWSSPHFYFLNNCPVNLFFGINPFPIKFLQI